MVKNRKFQNLFAQSLLAGLLAGTRYVLNLQTLTPSSNKLDELGKWQQKIPW